jgi:predicted metal-binding membrane protein
MGGVSVTAAGGRLAVERSELREAFGAIRTRLGLVLGLLALAGLAWWSTAERMAGMSAAPGSDLGALGWFVGVWVVMMAAMMFPSLAPTTALYARMTRTRGWSHPLLFTGAYLLVWGGAGVASFGLFRAGAAVFGSDLAWRSAGRWLVGATLVLAAVYELTPLKDVCLGKCRGPLSFLLGTWRDGRSGALLMGAKHAIWCMGCCWGLMAALFALGVMNVAWMAVVAALIALEKTLPWRRAVTWGTAAVLLALAAAVLVAPHAIPGFVVPGGESMSMSMHG